MSRTVSGTSNSTKRVRNWLHSIRLWKVPLATVSLWPLLSSRGIPKTPTPGARRSIFWSMVKVIPTQTRIKITIEAGKPYETVSRTQCETQQREDETPAQPSSLHWSSPHRQRTQTWPRQIKAMLEMPKPADVAGVQRLIRFVNYLSKFLPRLSDVRKPLMKLMAKDDHQDQAFQRIRQLVTEAPILKYYEPTEDLTLQGDVSPTGLGAVLTQNGQPLAFSSRALSEPWAYAQREKELLSAVFGLEKYHQYTYGRKITVQTDHKPLEAIVKKPLPMAPKRLQPRLLRLLVYDADLTYRCGRQMQLADTPRRAYLPLTDATPFEMEVQSVKMVQYLPLAAARLDDTSQALTSYPERLAGRQKCRSCCSDALLQY